MFANATYKNTYMGTRKDKDFEIRNVAFGASNSDKSMGRRTADASEMFAILADEYRRESRRRHTKFRCA